MKKLIITLVTLVIFGGGYFFYQKNLVLAPIIPAVDKNQEDSRQTNPSQIEQSQQEVFESTSTKESATSPANDQARFSGGEEEVVAPDIRVWQIDYDGNQFSPKTLNIKVGDYVIFKNIGTTSFWPASNPHPAHTDYPGFDASKTVDAGGKYQFQFEKIGTWGFHDHLNPGATGTVTVTR